MMSRLKSTLRHLSITRLTAAALLTLAMPGMANAGAVITFGNTSLGINDTAELNFAGNGPGGFSTYGVFRSGVGDAISPGCLCEGWGVSTSYGGNTPTSGFANRAAGSGGLTGGVFGSTASSASSSLSLSGAPISVRHTFGASLAADTFQVNVTIANTGTETAHDLTYRRVMDWDVPPTIFNEYVTHGGVTANLVSAGGNVAFASDDGFASANPLSGASAINASTINTDFVGSGPDDHGSLFDFSFGDLAAGESRLFNIYYGSAATKADAMAAIASVSANVYSLGQNSTSDGIDPGTPATFFFAFGGVAGVEPGTTPTNPLLPIVATLPDGTVIFNFPAPTSGRWFDPPFSEGFTYELEGGASFTSITAPPIDLGFAGPFGIFVDGISVGSILPGGLFTFGTGVSRFDLRGIAPYLDTASPGFSTAFPVLLDWTGTADLLTLTPILISAAVPEPAAWAMMITGFGLVGAAVRRRRQSLAIA